MSRLLGPPQTSRIASVYALKPSRRANCTFACRKWPKAAHKQQAAGSSSLSSGRRAPNLRPTRASTARLAPAISCDSLVGRPKSRSIKVSRDTRERVRLLHPMVGEAAPSTHTSSSRACRFGRRKGRVVKPLSRRASPHRRTPGRHQLSATGHTAAHAQLQQLQGLRFV